MNLDVAGCRYRLEKLDRSIEWNRQVALLTGATETDRQKAKVFLADLHCSKIVAEDELATALKNRDWLARLIGGTSLIVCLAGAIVAIVLR